MTPPPSKNPLDRVLKPTPGWYAGDFHCHTHHSDGALSPPELLDTARQAGLDFFAITDHNTTASYPQFGDPADMLILPGLEVTFDHGHFNVFGNLAQGADALAWAAGFVPGPTEIELRATEYALHDLIAAADAAGLLTSINHPLMPPWCWLDPATDLAHVHCVEIWNDPSWPDGRIANPAAVELWTQWLNAGYRITALGGSDFHRPQPKAGSQRVPEQLGRPRTYVYAAELSGRAILDGVRQGRAYMSMGPQLSFGGEWQGARVEIGQDLGEAAGPLHLTGSIAAGYHGQARLLRNGEPVAETVLTGGPAHLEYATTLDPAEAAWFRLDVHAYSPQSAGEQTEGEDEELLWAVTNPIYSGPAPSPTPKRYGDFVETPLIRRAADRLQWPRLKSPWLPSPATPIAQSPPYREA